MQLVLASASPRRLELLQQLGIEPTVRPPDVDESVRRGESATDYVQRVAREKCIRVLDSAGDLDVVIAADTTVVLDGEILGKPADADDAIETLLRLAGRSHQVLTGVALGQRVQFDEAGDDRAKSGGIRIIVDSEETTVAFGDFTREQVERYVATGEPLDKAGSYAIHLGGSLFVDGIEGSADNVIGLPRRLTARMFTELGMNIWDFAGTRHTG